jgi:hypothetical protein
MSRTSRISQIALLAGLLFAWAATTSAQDIKFNYLQGTDFSKYKTYKWVKVPNAKYPNQVVDDQIIQAIDAQLVQKGLTKTEDNPDLYVTYQAAITSESQWIPYRSGDIYWDCCGWVGWGGSNTATTIHIGSLDCDIYDVSTKKAIWRGEASKTLGSGKDPQKVQKNIDKAVAKLFKKYPPPAGK